MPQSDYFVHESSYVDEPCSIGAGTKIWHFSHVMSNCQIGERCNIGQNVVISPDVVIGNNVKLQNNVSVYTGCILEDDVFCGPSLRDETEWQETLQHGCNVLAGAGVDQIVEAARNAHRAGPWAAAYGDGASGPEILKVLLNHG
jgi:NDP-sugar pyrophosphorylase family protein